MKNIKIFSHLFLSWIPCIFFAFLLINYNDIILLSLSKRKALKKQGISNQVKKISLTVCWIQPKQNSSKLTICIKNPKKQNMPLMPNVAYKLASFSQIWKILWPLVSKRFKFIEFKIERHSILQRERIY